MKRSGVLAVAVVLGIVTVCCGAPKSAMVRKVIEGDTLEIAIEGKTMQIRLMGVKTEQGHNEDAAKNTEFGKVTYKHVCKHLKRGTPVQVEFEGEKKAGEDGDRLAYVKVMLEKKAEGKDAKPQATNWNLELVKKGWSPYYTEYGRSSKYDFEFRRAEMQARTNKLGIWASKDKVEEYKKKRIEWDAKAVEMHDPAGAFGNVNDDGIQSGTRRDLSDKKVPMASGRLLMMRDKPVEYPYVSSEKMKVFHKKDCKEALMIPNKDIIRYVSRQQALMDKKTPCPLCNP